MSRRGLGRGLASLIPDDAFDASVDESDRLELRMVPLDEIRANPVQPRERFEPEALEALAASIRAHGILSPLVVRRFEGQYVLIAGERRLRAAGLAGLAEVPVVLREADEVSEQLELALVENLQRADLDPVEAARGYRALMEDHGYTQEDVARRVGCDRSTVANTLRLLKLPDFALEALRAGRIRAGHARALLPLGSEEAIRTVLARVLAQGLSVRSTERLVREHTREASAVRTIARERRERTFAYATKLLRESLRTNVAIRPLKRGGGRIVLDYSDDEELERLIQQLRGSDG